jgi:hypothetical protein
LGKVLLFIAAAFLCHNINYAQNEPSGRISGLVYADFFYNVQRDSGSASLPNRVSSGNEDHNGFEIRRMYLTYDHKISSRFNARVRLESDGITLTQNNRIGVFLKDAYLRWKDILPGQDLIFGIQPTPAFEISEGVYGFRSLEKTILDLRGVVSSRDFGISARGRITEGLGYWVMLGNSSSNSPENDRYKRVYAHLNYVPFKNFVATIYSDLRFRQKTEDPLSPAGELLSNNVLTTALFFGYNNPEKYSLGVEGFYQNFNNEIYVNQELLDRNAGGLSLFGSLDLHEKLRFTARYDLYDPAINTDIIYDKRHFYIIGLSYKPDANVQIIPNVVIESYEQPENRSIESAITPRLTLAYNFL